MPKVTPDEIDNATWKDVADTVEALIEERTTMRKMTFGEFSKEVGMSNAQAFRLIRGGILPHDKNRKKIIKWVKKNYPSTKPRK